MPTAVLSPTTILPKSNPKAALAARLREFDIPVYSEEACADYRQQAEQAVKRRLWMQVIGCWLVDLAVACVLLLTAKANSPLTITLTIAGIAGVAAIVVGIVQLLMGPYWTQYAPDVYRKRRLRRNTLPLAVESIMDKVEAHIPGAWFRIEVLGLDPILYVCDGSYSCRVPAAIWKRPGRNQPLIGQ